MELQFITHYTDRYSYFDSACMALKGGCRWIQLRMKDASEAEITREALRILPLCREHGAACCRACGATFILDDRVALVGLLGADGVHLGKNDMPVDEARKILGKQFIIGGTANTIEDVRRLHQAGTDYIGCGPFRFTTTKKNLSPILGLDGYRNIVATMKQEHIELPIVAIGGITCDDIPAIMQTGVSGIALSGTILRADSPAEETHRILEEIRKYRTYK